MRTSAGARAASHRPLGLHLDPARPVKPQRRAIRSGHEDHRGLTPLELGPKQTHIGEMGYAVEIVRYGPPGPHSASAFPAYLLPDRCAPAALAKPARRLAFGKLPAQPNPAHYNVLDDREQRI